MVTRRHPWYVVVLGSCHAGVLLVASVPWLALAAFRGLVLRDSEGADRALRGSPAARYSGWPR